jgi:flagellar hook-associated protein 2
MVNLQGVETPWKTQLTALESQDTAISSLGTLFSNLSNDMSSLTDAEGILAEKTGSSSDTNVLSLTAANASAAAGTHTVTVTSLAQTSSGYLAPVSNADATLSGSVTLADNGAAVTVKLSSSDNTLAGLAAAINATGVGITASVLTDSAGSRLSLVSGTSGADGNITVSANSIVASNAALGYVDTKGYTPTTKDSGALTSITNVGDALSGSISIQVGGGTAQTVSVPPNSLTSPSNNLTGLAGAINTANIGVTASVITNSDGSSSLSLVSGTVGSAGALTVTSSIVDASASLGYTAAVTGSDAQLTIDGVTLASASNTVANLIPGVTFQLLAPSAAETGGGLEQIQVVIGTDNTDVESTVGKFVSDYNSLISGINDQEGLTSSGTTEPLFGSPTLSLLQQQLLNGLNAANPNGYLAPITTSLDPTLAGSMTISVGGGTTENIVIGAGTNTSNTFYTGSGVNSLSGVASAINKANIGLTASVVTTDGQQTLALLSQTAGSSGTLSVNSSIAATSDTALSYSDAESYTSTTADSGALTGITNASDALSGSVTIQVGNGATKTISVPPHSATSPSNNLAGLAGAINTANLGVTASVVTNKNGSHSLSLLSKTVGSAGALTVTSSILDTTHTSTATLNYTNSSDINSLTGLGISVNSDGSLTLDSTSLDSVLNSDYSSVIGFFQNTDSWGQTFSNMLTNAGTGSATGILSLASSSDSTIESTLNADISRENSLISISQTSLTTELNTANQIMQQLPTQLAGINELYSAITGYGQNSNG